MKKASRLVGPFSVAGISIGLTYKGADDKAGPNYTGQDAVDSYYS